MQHLADFDLDGDIDVLGFEFVPTSHQRTAFRPLWNNGQGELSQGAATALPSRVFFTAVADVNGDGQPDVVAVENIPIGLGTLTSTIHVYPGLPGGAFAAAVSLPLSGALIQMSVAEANGDGRDDLLVQVKSLGTPVTVDSQWLFGNANHTWSAGPQFVLPFELYPGAIGALAHETIVADMNGDQLADIAVAVSDYPTQQLELFYTTPTGVSAGPSLPLNALAYLSVALVSIDTDHDGDLDIALVSSDLNDSAVTTFRNLGAGVWSPGSLTVLGGSYAGLVAAGDLDGDGQTDLCLKRSVGVRPMHELHWVRSTGPDAFAFAGSLDVRHEQTGSFAMAGCADLDGDGRDELLDFQTIVFGHRAFAIEASQAGRWLLDWDQDGDLDSLIHFEVLRNDGTGEWAQETIPYSFLPGKFYVTPHQFLGDLDGDGLLDMTFGVLTIGQVGVPNTRRMRQTGNGQFVDAGLAAPVGTSPFSTREETLLQDFDGDGDLDILSFHEVWLNDGSGFFTPSGVVFAPGSALEQGDVDGDGDLDILCTGNHRDMLLSRRTGPSTFTTTTLFTGGAHSGSASFARVFADLDDDGDLDAAGVRSLNSASGLVHELIICENVNGVLAQAVILPFGGPIAAGDVDGDGKTDLCASHDEQLVVLRRTGAGLTYAPPVRFACPPVRKLVDLDQDGDLDGWGESVIFSSRMVAPSSGFRRQYGEGTAGTDDRRPLLSVRGQLRPGETPIIQLRHAPGGTFAFLMVADAPADGPSVVLPGVYDYVSLPSLILTYATTGTAGQPGAGSVDVPVTIPSTAAGADLFLEFLVFDGAAPGLLTNSNGCQLFVGQ